MPHDLIPRDDTEMKKRSVVIAGHRTSVSLENIFWDRLRDLAERRDVSVNQLATWIDQERGEANLSSAIRCHVMRQALGEVAEGVCLGPAR